MPGRPRVRARGYRFPEGPWNEKPSKANKYYNEPCEVDGIKFPSRKEARRYGELRILERAGKIRDLKLQPKYPLRVNNQLICTYIADFEYSDVGNLHGGGLVVEDVKGVRTRVYIIKKKLFEATYPGFKVVEI